MLQHQRVELEKIGIKLKAENKMIHFGFAKMSQVRMELGVSLMEGKFDVNSIGAYSYLGGGESIVRNVSNIGRFCSIAPNLTAGLAERPVDFVSSHRFFQNMFVAHVDEAREYLRRNQAALIESRSIYNERHSDDNTKITIGNDVWIGEGVLIRRGVSIGNGAIIAARSVVNKDVPDYAVVGGVPAKTIRMRFDEETCGLLQKGRWWDYGPPALEGISFVDANLAAKQILKNIERDNLPLWNPASKTVLTDGTIISEDLKA